MDLNDFGTHSEATARPAHHDNNNYGSSGIYGSSETPTLPIQWKLAMPGVFEACGTTFRKLPAGAYGCSINQYGEPQFVTKDLLDIASHEKSARPLVLLGFIAHNTGDDSAAAKYLDDASPRGGYDSLIALMRSTWTLKSAGK